MKRLILVLALLWPVTLLAEDYKAALDAYNRTDFATAYQQWVPLAEQGDAPAELMLGLMYYNGQGVPQDYAEAVKWFRLAAEQGHAKAQSILGAIYATGHGMRQDSVQAFVWWNLAAAQGRRKAGELRGKVRKFMTRAQIAEGQKLSRELFERLKK